MVADATLKVLEYVTNVKAIHADLDGIRLSDIQRELKLTDEQCRNAFGELHDLALINLVPGPDHAWFLVPLMTNIAHFVVQRAAEMN